MKQNKDEERKKWLQRTTAFVEWTLREINSAYTVNRISKVKRDEWQHDLEHIQDCIDQAVHDENYDDYIKNCLKDVTMDIFREDKGMSKGNKNRQRNQERREQKAETVETKQVGYSTVVTKLETPNFRKPDTEKESIYVKKSTPSIKLPDVEVHIQERAFRKIMTWTKLLDVEVTGLGIVNEITPGKFFVSKIYLFEQTVSGGACAMRSPQAFVELCQRIEADGEDVSKLKFWWHSHNKLSAYFSSTDETTGNQYKSSDWLVSLVTNHRDEMSCKINYYKPIEFVITDVPVLVDQEPIQDQFIEEMREELKKYVREESTTSYVNYHGVEYPITSGQTPLERAREELSAQTSRPQNSDDGPVFPHPFGEEFEENGFIYRWNHAEGYYEFFLVNKDGTEGRKLTEIEIEELGGDNYNKNLVYKNSKNAPALEGG